MRGKKPIELLFVWAQTYCQHINVGKYFYRFERKDKLSGNFFYYRMKV